MFSDSTSPSRTSAVPYCTDSGIPGTWVLMTYRW